MTTCVTCVCRCFDTENKQPTTPKDKAVLTPQAQDFALWENFVLAEPPPLSRKRRLLASLPDSDNEEQQEDAAQQVDSDEEVRLFLQDHLGQRPQKCARLSQEQDTVEAHLQVDSEEEMQDFVRNHLKEETRAEEIRRKVKEAIRRHITKDQLDELPYQGRNDQGSTADAVPQTPQLEATLSRRNDQGSPALAGHKKKDHQKHQH